MPISTHYHSEHQLYEVRLGGELAQSDLARHQGELARHIEAGDRPRVLVILDGFEGWRQGDDWGNLGFMFTHGTKITRIAFVGDKKWEDQFKLFVGAGLREAQVDYFDVAAEQEALAWLLQ